MSLNLSSFVSKVQKHAIPNYNLKRTTVDSLCGFLDLNTQKLVEIIHSLLIKNKRQTIDVGTSKLAVELLFPEHLAREAINHGYNAVARFKSSKDKVLENSPSASSQPLNVTNSTVAVGVAVGASGADTTMTVATDKSSGQHRMTRSLLAGLFLPVSRIENVLRMYSQRVSSYSSIFITAVLETVLSNLLFSSAEVTSIYKRKQVTVFDLNKSIWGFNALKSSVQIKKNDDFIHLAKRIGWGVMSNGWAEMYTGRKPGKKSPLLEETEKNQHVTIMSGPVNNAVVLNMTTVSS